MNETNPSIKHEKLQGTTNMAQENNFRIKVQRQKQVHVRNNYCVLTLNRVLSIITHNILQCKMFWWRNKLVYILNDLRESSFATNFHFRVNFSLNLCLLVIPICICFFIKKGLCMHEYPATGFRSVLWCLFLEMFS